LVAAQPAAGVAAQPLRPDFTELRVSSAPSLPKPTDCCELRWRDGLTLAIPQAVRRHALRRLLAVLINSAPAMSDPLVRRCSRKCPDDAGSPKAPLRPPTS
jgi:hypothetical protein